MRRILSISAILLCTAAPVWAQTESQIPAQQAPIPPGAMKTYKVTAPEFESEQMPRVATPTIKPKKADTLKPLPPEQAVKPLDEIPEFAEISQFLSLRSDASINRAREIVTLTPDAVPPLAYYYLARALADQGDFESAAFYYYVAELRNEFDRARFPAYQLRKPEDNQPTMRTPEQIGAVPTGQPRIVDPRGAYSDLTKNLGMPIRAWIVKHPDQFRTILARVKLWDAATPYAYRPPYDISGAVDSKKWAAMLTKTRSAFFSTQQSVAGELDNIDVFTPPRPFGRE